MANAATINLITEFEGFVDHWYPDPALGWKVPTAMFGHTDAAGQPYYKDTKDKKFTREEGKSVLNFDLRVVEASVSKLVKVPLNENQFGALVSFTYNLGQGNLAKSTLLKKLNAGDYAGAAGQFRVWNKAGGKVLAGLTRRREAEAKLFSTPVVSKPSVVQETVTVKVPTGPATVVAPKPPEGAGRLLAVIGSLIIGAGAGLAKHMGWF